MWHIYWQTSPIYTHQVIWHMAYMWHLRGIYFALVWLVYVPFIGFCWMCTGMWGLYLDYSRGAMQHILAMW